jgi:hypothetical protein
MPVSNYIQNGGHEASMMKLNLKWISDEIACCEPINDFKKNSQALYPVLVVQIWAPSYRISRNLSFS